MFNYHEIHSLKKVSFRKFAHSFLSLNMISENNAKVRMTHFNISLDLNAGEMAS